MGERITFLYCGCSSTEVIPTAIKRRLHASLVASGMNVIAISDLCRLAALRDPRLQEFGKIENLKIVACYPRAIRWLFYAGGAPLPESIEIFNMRQQDGVGLKSLLSGAEVTALPPEPEKEGDLVPWFPVIDYSRCADCRQCLNFCLFGVYSVSKEERVAVTQPWNCKTNCPACARICPQVAIIFPKLGESPINGAEIKDEEVERERVKLDIEKILGSDPYEALKKRQERARLRLLKKGMEQALEERNKCAESHGFEAPGPAEKT